MNKPKNDFEVWIETHDGMRVAKFSAAEYATLEEQETYLFDLLRDCRLSDTKYTVYKDGELINL